jgi:O-antigen/teichoic acid export membrane protein
MNKDTKASIILFIESLLGFLTKLALNVFLARYLSEALFGDYKIATKVLNIMGTLVLFGTNVSISRFFAKYLCRAQYQDSSRYVAWNIKLISITFAISLLISAFALTLMLTLHHMGIKHISHYYLATYMIWITPVSAIFLLSNSFLNNTGKATLSTIYGSILKYLTLLAFFYIVIKMSSDNLDNLQIVLIMLVALMVNSTISIATLSKDVRLMLFESLRHLKQTPVNEQKWLTTSLRLISNNIFYIISCALDLIIIELLVPNENKVAHYAACLSIVGITRLIPISICQMLKSELAFLLKDNKSLLQKRLSGMNRLILLILIILVSLIILFSAHLLLMFGTNYVHAQSILCILTVSTAVSAYFRFAIVILMVGGHERYVLKISIIEFLMMFILVAPATYVWGLVGTAFASSFIQMSKPIIGLILCRKKMGIKTYALWSGGR